VCCADGARAPRAVGASILTRSHPEVRRARRSERVGACIVQHMTPDLRAAHANIDVRIRNIAPITACKRGRILAIQ